MGDLSIEYKLRIVSGILIQDDKVLLGLRRKTEYFAGYWSLPVGHVEDEEPFQQTLKREFAEELGLEVIKATFFCVKIDEDLSIYHQIFIVEDYNGDAVNLEPDLCSELSYFGLDNLPKKLTPITKEILTDLQQLQEKY